MGRGVAARMQSFMHFFLPKEEEFFELFAGMAVRAHTAAIILEDLCAKYPQVDDQIQRIHELEHDADTLRHDCVRRLHATFVTPIMFDRQDILELADTLDDVLDNIKAAADRIELYAVEQIPSPVPRITRALVEATKVLSEACGRLEIIRPEANDFVKQINEIENEADAFIKHGLAELFRNESNPVEVIKWKEIYDYLEEAIDCCEDTANTIETALVKNS
jgi:uncharacterized protein